MGGRRRCSAPGPMQVQVDIDVIVVAIGHGRIDEGLVIGLTGGAAVRRGGLGVSVPPILIDGDADQVDVPVLDGFLHHRQEITARGSFPRGVPFG